MTERIKIKLISRNEPARFARYFPDPRNFVNGLCDFTLDRDATKYDWLAVYEDLPGDHGQRASKGCEALQCARQNTLLITSEPHTIKEYDRHYTEQFGHVLTAQPESALKHPHRIYSQPALVWFYGFADGSYSNIADIANGEPTKDHDIAMVGSNKRQRFTAHHKRYSLLQSLMSAIPEIDVYGRGFIPMPDKAQSIDPYRYHIAIENYIGVHHWTEKLSDPYLGLAMPIYAGCPNAADYFPEESFVAIDIDNHESSIETIRKTLRDNVYEQSLLAIREARRRVLEEYNLIAAISRIVEERYVAEAPRGGNLLSRRGVKMRYPVVSLVRAAKFKGLRVFKNS
ncbi:MAG: glycosyltransferase family 10 [Pseudomonadales bacterium]